MDRLNAVLEALNFRFNVGCRTCDDCENLPECAGLDVSAFELLQEYIDRCARYADEIMALREKQHWMPLPDAPEVTWDGEAERLPAEAAGEPAAEHAPAAAAHHSAVRGHGADHARSGLRLWREACTEFLEKFRETFEAYASLCLENAKGDANMDYTKGCIDRELARIMGSAFQPWEVRYPEKVFGGK